MTKKTRRKPDPEWDHVYQSNYASALFSDTGWKRQADALLAAAALVETEVRSVWQHNMEWLRRRQENDPDPAYLYSKPTESFAIHFMLVGFALENLLKAVLVHQNYRLYREEFEKSGELPKPLRDHDLFRLAKAAGLTLTGEDEDLLRRMSRAAIWAGRYPIPIDFRATATAEEFSDGEMWSVAHFYENDSDRVVRLVADIRAALGI